MSRCAPIASKISRLADEIDERDVETEYTGGKVLQRCRGMVQTFAPSSTDEFLVVLFYADC